MKSARVLVTAASLLAATSVSAETLVVLNKAEATASLIDLASGSVVATLPTGEGPHEAAVSPDGRRALSANYGTRQAPGSTLTLIDIPAARIEKTIDLGEHRRPHGLAWLDGRRVVVTAEASRALLLVDVEAGRVEASIPTGQEVSHMVAVTPDGLRAFVANIGSGSVTAVDLAALKGLGNIATGRGAEGIAVTPDGKTVWVTNRAEDTVSVIDAQRLQVLASLPSKSFPIRARVTPDGKRVLVSNARSGDLAVFDVERRAEVARIALKLEATTAEGRLFGDQFGQSSVPIGVVIHPDGRRAWVAHANADAISVLDLEKGAPIGTLRAGKEPDGMAYSPLSAGTVRDEAPRPMP
jgi:YVTN family beta-propeller protein